MQAIDNAIVTGVLLALYGDPGFNMNIERAPDVGGAPGAFVSIITGLPAGTPTFFDHEPLGSGPFWYRMTQSAPGYTTSAYSPAVQADVSSYFSSQLSAPAPVLSEIPRSFADPTDGATIVQNLDNAGDVQITMGVTGGQTPLVSSIRPELIPNPDFDVWAGSLPYGWPFPDTGHVTIARDAGVVYSGAASLKLSDPDATSGGYHGLATDFALALRPGRRYRLLVASRVSRVGAGQRYQVLFWHNHAFTLSSSNVVIFGAANTWQVDEFVFAVPAGAEALSLLSLIVSRNGDVNPTDFWFDALRITEEGASVSVINNNGQVDLSLAGVVNKSATYIQRSPTDSTPVVTIIQKVNNSGDLAGDINVVAGDLYVESTKAPRVGSIASPSSRTKIMMIPGPMFIGNDNTVPWWIATSFLSISGATGTQRILWCPVVLPPGVTITEVAFRSIRSNTLEQSLLRLYRVESDTSSVLATIDDTNTPINTQRTLTASISEVTSTARTYMLEWDAKTQNPLNTPALGWVRITYTMDTYDKSL